MNNHNGDAFCEKTLIYPKRQFLGKMTCCMFVCLFVFCHIHFKIEKNRETGVGAIIDSCYNVSDSRTYLVLLAFHNMNVTI